MELAVRVACSDVITPVRWTDVPVVTLAVAVTLPVRVVVAESTSAAIAVVITFSVVEPSQPLAMLIVAEATAVLPTAPADDVVAISTVNTLSCESRATTKNTDRVV